MSTMTNSEKIWLVEEIVAPYFHFYMDADIGRQKHNTLFFKYNEKEMLTTENELELLVAVKKLHIGMVDISTVNNLGRCIRIAR